ncbi:hypothetical protein PN498_20560 [Oscillatoria sp. CS-180]|nr:hypothetical protein [Oscillatoria sp. CS-180]
MPVVITLPLQLFAIVTAFSDRCRALRLVHTRRQQYNSLNPTPEVNQRWYSRPRNWQI